MKLTKFEARKITKQYGLGRFRDLKEIKGGWDNYDFMIKIGKGEKDSFLNA